MSSLCDLDTNAVVWSMVVVVVCVVWWLSTRRPPGLPPGPGPALPLLGHLHLMKKDPREQFQQWRRQYGDVFSLYLGGRLVVVLNGLPVIKEALVNMADVFSDRPHNLPLTEGISKGKGLVFSSGANWKAQRKASLKILREIGFGKNMLAEKIEEEITYYIQYIADLEGRATDLGQMTTTSISNNICSILFGKRFEYNDPVFKQTLRLFGETFKHLFATNAINHVPFLKYIPGDLFHVKKVESNFATIDNSFMWPQIRKLRDSFVLDQNPKDFIHAYMMQMDKVNQHDEITTLNEENLWRATWDLFLAGTETTSITIRWALLLLLHYPHVQDRCFKEISDVIGTDRQPSSHHRAEMTYMEAVIMEVLRRSDIGPFSLPHGVSRDVTFRDYVIPKDSVIITNLNSVLQDPSVWGDPENFRPERFIGADGKIVQPDEFIPFGTGRRACLGKSMARLELFLYLSTLIQHFRFLPPEDDKLPSLEGTLEFLFGPKPFKIRAIPRNKDLGPVL